MIETIYTSVIIGLGTLNLVVLLTWYVRRSIVGVETSEAVFAVVGLLNTLLIAVLLAHQFSVGFELKPGQYLIGASKFNYLTALWLFSFLPILLLWLSHSNMADSRVWAGTLFNCSMAVSGFSILQGLDSVFRRGFSVPFGSLPLARQAFFIYSDFAYFVLFAGLMILVRRRPALAGGLAAVATVAVAVCLGGRILLKFLFADYYADKDLKFVLAITVALIAYMLFVFYAGLQTRPTLSPETQRRLMLAMSVILILPAGLPFLYWITLSATASTDPGTSAIVTAIVGGVAGVIVTEAWKRISGSR